MLAQKTVCIGLLIAVCTTLSCRPQSCGRCIGSVFEGFNFVGDYPVTVNGSDMQAGRVQSFPPTFERGRVYIFQPIGRTDTARVAIRTLPDRLRKCSATILYAPRSTDEFAAASLGGPIWGIRFRIGRCLGEITNKYDRKLDAARIGWPSGSRDDYVLRLSEAP